MSKLKRYKVHYSILTESGEYPKTFIINFATNKDDARSQFEKLMSAETNFQITNIEAL